MVTENTGEARRDALSGDGTPKRPRPHHIPIPRSTPYSAPASPSTRGGPYRAYQPGISPVVAQPPTSNPPSPNRLIPSFPASPFRSPTYPVIKDEQPPPHGAQGRPTPAAQRYTPPDVLRPSASTSNLRARQRSPYRHENFRTGTGTGTQSPTAARIQHHYHNPELHFDDQPRSSLQSALTASSVEPTSGTERSSVLTKNSSMTDLSPDASDVDGGMSVDDAISMYLEGFSDDPPTETNEEPKTRIPDKINNRRLSEVPETVPVDGPADEPSVDPEPGNSTVEEPPKKQFPPPALPGAVPPALLEPTDERDRYGFRKGSHHISSSEYEAWNKPYSNYVENRRLKWEQILKDHNLSHIDPVNFPPKSAKLGRYVRKGIPPEFRGPAWFWYAGGYVEMHRHPGLYRQLVEHAFREPTNDDKEHIERDLHRTFPDNIHFKPDPPPDSESQPSGTGSSNPKHRSDAAETQVIHALRRVLYAFAVHNPKIGYTQSLNFIAGLLLLFLPEEKAFWMLHIITSIYLPGTHEISLEGANVDLWILMVRLRESLPAVYTKVASTTPTNLKSKPPAITTKTRLPDITLGLTNWLMSLYIGSLPLETTLRVWDVLFYEGSRTFFTVALAILKSREKEILALNDPMEVFQIVQVAPKKLLDPNALIETSYARRFRLSQSRVEDLRAARRAAIKQDKERASFLMGGKKHRFEVNERPSTGATSPLPVSAWRNLKNHAFG